MRDVRDVLYTGCIFIFQSAHQKKLGTDIVSKFLNCYYRFGKRERSILRAFAE